jgi:tellurite resistance protein TerC
MTFNQIVLWAVFATAVLFMLFLDLFVFNRKAHEIKIKEALIWSVVWISVSLIFNLAVYLEAGPEKALNFFTGYLIEKTLSMDNIFVFLLIFNYFKVPGKYQHKILFWGILGALVIRGIFIVAGITLIERFHWMIYVFGVFLVFTGIKMAFKKDEEIDPSKNPVFKLCRKFMPLTEDYHEGHFFVKKDKRLWMTPLFMTLLIVETTDVVFAVDSIPAILAITTDPFIVYSSNIFAILGLRAMYFALAAMVDLFHYLQHGLSLILVFIGVKMLLGSIYKIPVGMTLGIVALILAISVIASILRKQRSKVLSG